MCSRAEYCEEMVRKKIRNWSATNLKNGEKGFDEQEIDSVVGKLVKDKYICEERFVNAFIRDKARFQKWGEAKIVFNLKRLKINSGVISEGIKKNVEVFGDEVLIALINKKLLLLKEDCTANVKRDKVIRFCVGRGFPISKVIRVIDSMEI